MRLSLYNLEVFKAVCESHSVSQAAQRLFITQSAVSHQLRALEEALGLPLVVHEGRHLQLTVAGRRVYDYALRILETVEEMQGTLTALKTARSGQLVVAGSIAPGTYLLPPVAAAFKARHPDVDLKLRIIPTHQLVEEVVQGSVAVGITPVALSHPAITTRPLLAIELVLVQSDATPPEFVPSRLAEVASKPFVCILQELQGRENYDAVLRQYGIVRNNVVLEVGHPEGLKQAVRAGLAIGLTQRFIVDFDLRQGWLQEIRIPGLTLQGHLYVVHATANPLTPTAHHFLDTLVQYLADMETT